MLQLRPWQPAAVDFLASRRRALLADGMRVGKTPPAIRAAHRAGAQSLLVVTQAIATLQWEREIERWWLDGPLPRYKVWSYDEARARWEGGLRGTVDVFIPDECHFAGNPTAARTGMVYGKTGFAYQAGATWALSGTPAPKSAASLWPMLKAFGIVSMTYEEFLKRYCTLRPMSWVPTGTRLEMIDELRALLAKCMLRRTRKDVRPDSKDIEFSFLEIKPQSPADYKFPVGLSEADALVWLEENQNASKEDRIAVALAKAKPLSDEIRFCIENDLYKQTVVFGWHREPLDWMTQELNKRGLIAVTLNGDTSQRERERIMSEFRAGRIHVVDANIVAAGVAIDLASASHGYMLEMDWVPGNNVQAVHRLISMEKAEGVTIDVVTWPGSCDDWLQRVLLTRVEQLARLY